MAQATDFSPQVQGGFLSMSVGADCIGDASLGERMTCGTGVTVEFGSQDAFSLGGTALGWKVGLRASRSDDSAHFIESIDVDVTSRSREFSDQARAMISGKLLAPAAAPLFWTSGVEVNWSGRRSDTIARWRGEDTTDSQVRLAKFSVGPVFGLGQHIELGDGLGLELKGLASVGMARHDFDAEVLARTFSWDINQSHWSWSARLESSLQIVFSDPALSPARVAVGLSVARDFRSSVVEDQCWPKDNVCLLGSTSNAWSIFPQFSVAVPFY